MKEIKIRKINHHNKKHYSEYTFNVWESGHIIYSNSIKVEQQEIDSMIKYTDFIRQNKGCMLSTSIYVEKNNYNIDDVVKCLGHYLIQNRIRIKYERLQSRLNSFKQVSCYIYKYNNERDIRKFKRIMGELKNYMNKHIELMRLFDHSSINFNIINKFSDEHKHNFYSAK
jgi:hypothetical protein